MNKRHQKIVREGNRQQSTKGGEEEAAEDKKEEIEATKTREGQKEAATGAKGRNIETVEDTG